VTDTSITEEPKGKAFTVIRARKKLQIRRLTVTGQQQLDAWDLCAISLPTHPLFNSGNIVEHLKGAYLTLTFGSEAQRNSFNVALNKIFELRAKQKRVLGQSIQTALGMGNAIRHTVIR
jgi:hypothetical protein